MDFKKILMAFVALVVGMMAVQARQVWSAGDVPIPYLRDSTQYVSDPDWYLSKAEKDSANHYLQKLNLECGVQNVFVVVGRVKNQDAFRMAQDIGAKYGVGYKATRRAHRCGLRRHRPGMYREVHAGEQARRGSLCHQPCYI